MPENKVCRVTITYAYGPNLFYVKPHNWLVEHFNAAILKELRLDNMKLCPSSHLKVSFIYLVFIQMAFKRVKYLRRLNSGLCEVFTIDCGNRAIVSTDEFYYCPPKLWNIPYLAVKCSLYCSKNVDELSNRVFQSTTKICSGSLFATSVGTESNWNKINVNLYSIQNNKVYCINESF